MEENDNQEDNENILIDLPIDSETFLKNLLAYSADKSVREGMVDRISKKTNLPPETVEEIIKATIKILLNGTRSN